jgi:HK97 family phage major capsid protein
MDALVERRKRFDAKKAKLDLVFKQLGTERDWNKVTCLEGDDEIKSQQVILMGEELKKEDVELQKLVMLEDIQKDNLKRYEFHIPADVGVPMPDPGQQQKGQFKNIGEFCQRVVMNPESLKAMGINSGEDGGFAVPDEFRTTILNVPPYDAIVRPRATVLPPGDNPDSKLEIPALRQGASGILAGFSFTAVSEGTAGTAISPKLDLVTLEPQRMSGYVVVANSLLRNATAMSAFIESEFRRSKASLEDYWFIQGNGGGTYPLGFLNSPAALSVTRATASTIAFADVANMLAKSIAINTGIWICSQSALPQIIQLKDSVGNAIFISSGNAGAVPNLPSTLFGRPIYFTFRQPALGTKGDLMFVDPSYYLIKDGSGPFIQGSEHVAFTSDQTYIKMTFFIDAQPWVKTPIMMDDAVTQASPYVLLN